MASLEGFSIPPFLQQGLAVDLNGTIYVGDSSECKILKLDQNLKLIDSIGSIGSKDGQFQFLTSISLDSSNNLYTVDSFLKRIQVFNPKGEMIQSFQTALSKFDTFNVPTDLVVLDTGEILVCNYITGISLFSKDGQFIQPFSFDKKIKPGKTFGPNQIEKASNGMVYISVTDYAKGFSFVYAYDQNGAFISTVLRQNDSSGLFLGLLNSLSIDGNEVLVSVHSVEITSVQKYKITPDPSSPFRFEKIIASQKYKEFPNIEIQSPSAVFRQFGNNYILDNKLNRLLVVTDQMEIKKELQTPDYGSEMLSNPQGITFDKEDNILVCNSGQKCVSVFSTEGKFRRSFGNPPSSNPLSLGDFLAPTDVTINQDGYIFVSDSTRGIVQVFTPDYEPYQLIVDTFNFPQGLAFDAKGDLLVVNSYNSSLQKFSLSNIKNKKLQNLGLIPLQGDWPVGVAVTKDNKYAITFAGSNVIQILNPDNYQDRTSFGGTGNEPGELYLPQGICLDQKGNLYVAETGNGRIQKFTPDGKLIWTSDLEWPGLSFLTTDRNGKLYVTDCFHNLVLVFSDETIQLSIKPKFIKLKIGNNYITNQKGTKALEHPSFIEKKSGRTMVPLRAIAEAADLMVEFETKEQKIHLFNTEMNVDILLWIGKTTGIVNGKENQIDEKSPIAPFIFKSRTFLPLRFIGESMRYKVEWDKTTQTILMTFAG